MLSETRGIEIRLLDEEERAGLAGFERPLDRALAADHDDLRAGIERLHLLEKRDPVGVGQQQIEQDDSRPPRLKQLLGASAVAGGRTS